MTSRTFRSRPSAPRAKPSRRCRVCRRPLTDAASIRRGIGAACWPRMKGDQWALRRRLGENEAQGDLFEEENR